MKNFSWEEKEQIYKSYKHSGDFKQLAHDYNMSYPKLIRVLKEIGGRDFKILTLKE